MWRQIFLLAGAGLLLVACSDDDGGVNGNQAVCGNGVAEAGEVCDGAELNGQTCVSLGHQSGTLACTSACTWDTSGCSTAASCGNGMLDAGEECDNGLGNSDTDPDACRTTCLAAWCGDLVVDSQEDCDSSDLASTSCQDLGFDAGPLACDSGCTFDTSGCRQCGNDVAEPGEVCDGNDLGGESCSTYTGHTDGSLTCSVDCLSFVTDSCHTCGDGMIEGPETCDGANHGGATCWTAAGHASGTLSCVGCALDDSGCFTCGNTMIEGPEICDNTTFGGATCASLTGYTDGSLACDAGCMGVDTSGCHTCGNNTVEGPEQCDQSDLNGADCQAAAGLSSGSLGCDASCAFDTSGCYECGNGMIDGPEMCDGNDFGARSCLSEAGHTDGSLTCQAGCFAVDTSGCHTCGNSQIEGPEDCDSFNPGTATCVSLGHSGGWVTCGSYCRYDESGCWDCGNGTCEYEKGETWQNCVLDCAWTNISVAAGRSCATREDGSAWCWGGNYSGLTLGDCSSAHDNCPSTGNPDCSLEPVHVIDASTVLEVSAAVSHTCVVISSGQTWCWGVNSFGQLGDGQTISKCSPGQVINLPSADGISAGSNHSCALTSLGTIGCWGRNANGNFGDGTTNNSLVPVPTINLPTVHSLSTGGYSNPQTCAVAVDGTAWCWGDGAYGQLGDGSDVSSTTPVQVIDPSDPTGYLQGVADIATGEYFSCAMKGNGSVWCWGNDGNVGRLGDGQFHPDCGANDCSYTPVQVAGIVDAAVLSCGHSASCVVTGTGEAWCWGLNVRGALGDGSLTDRETPVQVVGISGAVDIATGGQNGHTCALLTNGSAWCWGQNFAGELGANISDLWRTTPVQVVGP